MTIQLTELEERALEIFETELAAALETVLARFAAHVEKYGVAGTNQMRMKILFSLLLVLALAGCVPVSAPADMASDAPLVINHTSVARFAALTESELAAARAMTLLLTDRSVGANIADGLDCMRRPYDQTLYHCIRFRELGITWDGVYPFPNWTVAVVNDVTKLSADDATQTAAMLRQSNPQVGGWLVSYLAVENQPSLAPLLQYKAEHPEFVLVCSTSSLARSSGATAAAWNNALRANPPEECDVLFDLADIESHTMAGQACYDTRDGVEYCVGDRCVNEPDDGLASEAICQDFTTEFAGGHLNNFKVAVAQAIWVMMADLAHTERPTPGPTVTVAPTVAPSVTPIVPTPTSVVVTPEPTDASTGLTAHIGATTSRVNVLDALRWQAIVTIMVHDTVHVPVVGALVSGYWVTAGVPSPFVACVTGRTGQCARANNNVPVAVTETFFVVTDIVRPGYVYAPDANEAEPIIRVAR